MSSGPPTDSLLQPQLDAITAQTRTLVQPERLAVTDTAIAELLATGIQDRILAAGAAAPGFALTDASTGRIVCSTDLLAVAPVVVVFFRGRWDPYCVTTLEAWQAAYSDVRARGALLVAVSPQLQRQNVFTAQQHSLAFPLLSDPGCALAEQFQVAHTLSESMQQHYRSILVNIPFLNGDESWRLPLPSTFLVRQDGIISRSEAHADHRVRTEPAEVLALLERSLSPADGSSAKEKRAMRLE